MIKLEMDEFRDFIINNTYLIDTFQFDKLYAKCDRNARSKLTQLFLDIDINPLEYMTVIPSEMYSGLPIKILYIPSNIILIDNFAFEDCDSLTNITIPESVISIGDFIFDGCIRLISITYKGTKEQWTTIKRTHKWLYNMNVEKIICSDGEILLNAYN